MEIRNVRHIYAQPLDIRLGDLRVLQFSLNRHLPEKNWVAAHTHRHAQFLLYLTGSGRQKIGETFHEVQSGTLFFLPARCEHSFVEGEGRRPLCLALDLKLVASNADKPLRTSLPQSALAAIRQALAALRDWQLGNHTVSPAEGGAVLEILDVLMLGAGLLPKCRAQTALPVVRRVREVFQQKNGAPVPINQLAEIVGYHRDHLSRILRRETGMSTGQLRAAETLKRAQTLLQKPGAIADIAEQCNFADPNYFSRWFRKQTGMTPRQWRETGKH